MKKKLTPILLTIAMLLSLFVMFPATTAESNPVYPYRCGDVTGTGTITISDTLEILKYLAKMSNAIEGNLAAKSASTFFSKGEEPTIADALETLKHLAKMECFLKNHPDGYCNRCMLVDVVPDTSDSIEESTYNSSDSTVSDTETTSTSSASTTTSATTTTRVTTTSASTTTSATTTTRATTTSASTTTSATTTTRATTTSATTTTRVTTTSATTITTPITTTTTTATATPDGSFEIILNENYQGSPANSTRKTDTYGNLMTALPSPTRNGDWAFAGWFTRESGGTRVISGANGTKFNENTVIYARWTPVVRETLDDIPAAFKENFDWLKNVRHEEPLGERNSGERVFFNANGSVRANNFIFDQIFAGDGTINWAVRWESDRAVTLAERQRIAAMLHEEVNKWTRPLIGFEDWPFGEIPVTVIGWAVSDASLILDRQPNEQIWVNNNHLTPLGIQHEAFMASAPAGLSRFANYRTANYQYPGGLHARYDMYLWATRGFGGGAGGDWGTRVSDNYIISAANGGNTYIITHEVGHGFGLYDFYGGVGVDRPPATITPDGQGNRNFNSGELRTVMSTGSNAPSATLGSYDRWQIRYYWNWVKNGSPVTRFVTPSNAPER